MTNNNMNGHKDSLDLVILGTFVQATWQRKIQILTDAAMGVAGGKIVFLDKEPKLLDDGVTFGNAEILKLNDNQFLMPGLIDSHSHASQFSYMGTGVGMELLDWLKTYTFPVEAKIAGDLDFAAEVYRRCVRKCLSSGSTTACYYATIGLESTMVLVDIIGELGQRAFVGKVNMDQESPPSYIENTHTSLADTRSFIKRVLERQNPLITPCITPRFAISCTASLMSELGNLAKEFSLPIQTHISENHSEIEFVKSMFPDSKSYAHVYDSTGLLGNRTILGHGVHLSSEEIDLIKQRGASVSHCPNSNFNLRSGVCDVKKLLDSGVKVGLGTDFGGGHSPSVLDAMRRALDSASVTSHGHKGEELLTYEDMFFLATLGNSKALGLQDVVGDFLPGKDFDALLVDVNVPGSPIEVFPEDTVEEKLQKFIFQGDDRNIARVYVKGRNVTPNTLSTSSDVSLGSNKLS